VGMTFLHTQNADSFFLKREVNRIESTQTFRRRTRAVIAAHKGLTIELQPTKVGRGSWRADFTLTEKRGPATYITPYRGRASYKTREDAKAGALDSAKLVIDNEKLEK
jgi:hypothetical protein